jgi:hypothetical protein
MLKKMKNTYKIFKLPGICAFDNSDFIGLLLEKSLFQSTKIRRNGNFKFTIFLSLI